MGKVKPSGFLYHLIKTQYNIEGRKRKRESFPREMTEKWEREREIGRALKSK